VIKVRKTVEKYAMLDTGDRVGVAVSGGADSVALLHVLSMFAVDYDLALIILHLNHGIRGEESDRDEAFVVELAGSMGIQADFGRVTIPELKRRQADLSKIYAGRKGTRFLRGCRKSTSLIKSPWAII